MSHNTHACHILISHRKNTCVSHNTYACHILTSHKAKHTCVSHYPCLSHIKIPLSETHVCLALPMPVTYKNPTERNTRVSRTTHACHIKRSHRAKHTCVSYYACLSHIKIPQSETYVCLALPMPVTYKNPTERNTRVSHTTHACHI